eukprot:2910487-Rhodomonas_salina.1
MQCAARTNSAEGSNASSDCLLEACGCPGWKFEEAMLKNGTSFESVVDCTGCQSSVGMSLDGVDDWIDLGPLAYGDTDLTFVAWIHMRSIATDWQRIFEFSSGQETNDHILAVRTGRLLFRTYDRINFIELLAPGSLALNTWVHVAVTISNAAAAISVNGFQVVSGSAHNLGLQNRT